MSQSIPNPISQVSQSDFSQSDSLWPLASGFLEAARAISDFQRAMSAVGESFKRASGRIADLTAAGIQQPKGRTRAQRKANPRRTKAGRRASKAYETHIRHAIAARFPHLTARRRGVQLATGRRAWRGQ
jgi:hypothetical protein